MTCSSRPGPEEPRPRHAIEQARTWARGEITESQARTAAGHVIAAARDLSGQHGPPRTRPTRPRPSHTNSVRAAYGLKAARAAAPEGEGDSAGRLECLWQSDQLPEAIRELVPGDQLLRQRHLLVNEVFPARTDLASVT